MYESDGDTCDRMITQIDLTEDPVVDDYILDLRLEKIGIICLIDFHGRILIVISLTIT